MYLDIMVSVKKIIEFVKNYGGYDFDFMDTAVKKSLKKLKDTESVEDAIEIFSGHYTDAMVSLCDLDIKIFEITHNINYDDLSDSEDSDNSDDVEDITFNASKDEIIQILEERARLENTINEYRAFILCLRMFLRSY
jgi:chemotaxis protein CheY-P-specific phosphatase CheC